MDIFLKEKIEAPGRFRKRYQVMEKQQEHRIKFLQTDQEGEFLSSHSRKYAYQRQFVVPCTPQQNGTVEHWH